MANRARGEVEIVDDDGRAYTWRLTVNAACALETRTGRKFPEVIADADALSLLAFRDVVWMVLQDYHAAEFPTTESAGEFIDRIGILRCLLKFRELIEVNQPRLGGGPASTATAANPPTPAGTGDDSTLRVAALA